MAISDEQRGRDAVPVDASEHTTGVELGRDRDHPLGETDQHVVFDVRVFVTVAEQLDRRGDEQQPEDQEHE